MRSVLAMVVGSALSCLACAVASAQQATEGYLDAATARSFYGPQPGDLLQAQTAPAFPEVLPVQMLSEDLTPPADLFYYRPQPGDLVPEHTAPPLAPEEPASRFPFQLPSTESWLEAVPLNPVTWDGSVELGINGSSGNSSSLSIQAGGELKRETDWSIWSVDFKYAKTEANSLQTQNFGLFNVKYEHLFGESPWSLYVRSGGQYDEFRSFDFLFFINTGIGYAFINNDSTKLKGRNGLGTSRRFGGADESWSPEINLGFDFEHQLTERQKFTSIVDYFPSWDDFTDYRIVADVGWLLLLDAEANLSLKVSIIDIYDSTPEESQPNDVNYAVLLLWKL